MMAGVGSLSANRQWFRVTPVWVVYGLLLVEAALFLSGRFQWFAFNERKGWTVLIAFGAVGSAMVLIGLWLAASLSFGWRFQFTILNLMVLTVAVAIPCGWLAAEMNNARNQEQAVRALQRFPGLVRYDDEQEQQAATPLWLRQLLGNDFFEDVDDVWLGAGEKFTDAEMVHVGFLPKLRQLHLCGANITYMGIKGLNVDDTQVTDAGLRHLKGLNQLVILDLGGTRVTDAGMKSLRALSRLECLWLDRTRVTDAGLQNLKTLPQLQMLEFDGTRVTDAGLEYLKPLSQLQALSLGNTKVTGAGLRHLTGLKGLQTLYIPGTQVTDAGLEYLQGMPQLRSLMLTDTPVTDAGLERIKVLTELVELYLVRTRVTDGGVNRLKHALPKCHIYR
jgi:hypothetical protein